MDGKLDKAKGRIKQAAGDLTNNQRLKNEGKIDEVRGNIKEGIDQAANRLKKQV